VRAEAVRAADRCPGGNEIDRASGDAIVVRDAVGSELARAEWPENNGAEGGGDEEDGDEARKPGRTEDRTCDEERRDRRGVVELDRRLSRDVGEEVRRELGQSGKQQERRCEEEPGERQRELKEIREVTSLRYRAQDDEWIGDRCLDDPAR
jgi:hypothetical protein